MLPVWLQRAGYRTAIVGKFLNGYENAVDDKDDVAPGWDLWSVEIGNGRGYYDFKLAVNGKQRKEHYKGEYLTDVINRRARRGRRRAGRRRSRSTSSSGRARPHVENINANSGGPCGGRRCRRRATSAASPARSCRGCPACSSGTSPTSPRSSAASRAIDAEAARVLRHRYQCRIETLPAVDRGVGRAWYGRCARPASSTTRSSSSRPTTAPSRASTGSRGQGPRLRGGRAPAARVRVPPKYRGGARRRRRSTSWSRTSTTRRPSSTGPAPRPARRSATAG